MRVLASRRGVAPAIQHMLILAVALGIFAAFAYYAFSIQTGITGTVRLDFSDTRFVLRASDGYAKIYMVARNLGGQTVTIERLTLDLKAGQTGEITFTDPDVVTLRVGAATASGTVRGSASGVTVVEGNLVIPSGQSATIIIALGPGTPNSALNGRNLWSLGEQYRAEAWYKGGIHSFTYTVASY